MHILTFIGGVVLSLYVAWSLKSCLMGACSSGACGLKKRQKDESQKALLFKGEMNAV